MRESAAFVNKFMVDKIYNANAYIQKVTNYENIFN